MLVIAGPTGSGKSTLALAIAEHCNGVIINADSAQVYRELRVLTARPSPDDEARAPHRLYGVLSAAERCSAGRWRELALAEIATARAQGRQPIVVGGTGLYLRSLIEGLAAIPAIPPEVRARAEALWAELGRERFRAALAECDPVAAARLPAGDRQRLLRAWAVVQATGRTLSDWQAAAPASAPGGETFATVVLLPPREVLYPALDARFRRMIETGAVDEVRRLLALHLDPSLPAMKALGVRELAGFLDATTSLEAAAAAAQQATRRFAKRQMTWLRHQVAAAVVLHEQYSESAQTKIFAFIRHRLLTRRT